MKIYLKCLDCCFRSFTEQLTGFEIDADIREEMTRVFLRHLSDMDYGLTPPHIARFLQNLLREKAGIIDPYYDLKKLYNGKMIANYSRFRTSVNDNPLPLKAALKLAVSGNIIDVGPNETFDIEGTIETALSREFEIDHSESMFDALRKNRNILYLADNAGEIVLDRLFIETLIKERAVDSGKLTVAVRGAPVQNDATMKEAVEAGLPDIVRVIDNGDGSPGTILEYTSENFTREFERADLIISKGQGNYETLCAHKGKKIFFLLIAKCPLIAEKLSVPIYSFVCLSSK